MIYEIDIVDGISAIDFPCPYCKCNFLQLVSYKPKPGTIISYRLSCNTCKLTSSPETCKSKPVGFLKKMIFEELDKEIAIRKAKDNWIELSKLRNNYDSTSK